MEMVAVLSLDLYLEEWSNNDLDLDMVANDRQGCIATVQEELVVCAMK